MTAPGLPAVVLAASLVAAAVAAVVLAREMRAARPRYGLLTGWLGNVVLFGSAFVMVKGGWDPSEVTPCSRCRFLPYRGRDRSGWCRVRQQGPPCPGVRPHRRGDRRGGLRSPPAVGPLRGPPGRGDPGGDGLGGDVSILLPGGRTHDRSRWTDWRATFGCLPGARKTKGWYVASRDRVLAEQLTQLGVLTLLQYRYGSVGQCWETELGAPEVCYSAESGRLRYLFTSPGEG